MSVDDEFGALIARTRIPHVNTATGANSLNSKNKLKFKLKNIDKGVIITSVKENSSAQDAGLSAGMVIVRVGQIEVNSLSVVDEAIKNALKKKRKALLLLVKVENGSRFVALELK